MRSSRKALAALSLAAFASSASASQLIYEPFNYTVGQPIAGQINTTSAATETWWDAGTASATPHQVASGSLSPSAAALAAGFPASVGNSGDLKLADNTENIRLNIPNAFNGTTPVYGANSTLYYSMLIDVPTLTGLTIAHTNLNANNDLIAAFNNSQGSQAAHPSSWNGELVIRLGSTAGTYNLGIRASTTTAGTTPTPTPGQTYWTGDLNPGDTHFIVVQAQQGATPGTNTNDTNSLWLDPDPSTFGAAVAPNADGSSNGAASNTAANDVMASLLLGAGGSSGGGTAGSNPNDTLVDEIRVGDTWADVTAAPTPEPSSIGLIGMGLAVLVGKRRRRCPA